MSTQITIPVLLSAHAADAAPDIGGAATVAERARESLTEHIRDISVDSTAIEVAIDAATAMLHTTAERASTSRAIRVDSLSLQLGVSATGSIGLLGTGANVQAAATFQITFKIVEA